MVCFLHILQFPPPSHNAIKLLIHQWASLESINKFRVLTVQTLPKSPTWEHCGTGYRPPTHRSLGTFWIQNHNKAFYTGSFEQHLQSKLQQLLINIQQPSLLLISASTYSSTQVLNFSITVECMNEWRNESIHFLEVKQTFVGLYTISK